MLIGDNNLYPKRGAHQIIALHIALFVWLISHQPAVFFSQNKSVISNQTTILFSQNKSAPAMNRMAARTIPTGHGGRATIRGHIPPPCVFPRESGARFIRRRVHASVRVRRPRAATRPAVAYRGRSASRRRACRSSLGGSRPGRTEGRVPVTLMI
jgi:hypothetical protein